MNNGYTCKFQRQKEFFWEIKDELLGKYNDKLVSITQNKIAAILHVASSK